MLDKTNILNSMSYEIEQVFKNNIPDEINIPTNSSAIINISRNPLTINSIDSSNKFWIVLLFPRLSNLRFSAESYGSVKKHSFRTDLFVISQSDQLSYQLISKLHYFFDKNEAELTKIGLKRPKIEKEFLKVSDSKIYSGGLTGNFSAFATTIYGEVLI